MPCNIFGAPLLTIIPAVNNLAPDVFNWIKVERASRQEHAQDIRVLFKPLLKFPTLVNGAVVLHKQDRLWSWKHGTNRWVDNLIEQFRVHRP